MAIRSDAEGSTASSIDLSHEILIRWAHTEDAALPFVGDGIPSAVVQGRIDDARIAIAELAGRPVGALQLEYLWGTRPYVAIIRVIPACQRRGVGRALLEFVASSLRDAGHRELWSSAQANEPEPQAWHRRMGFTESGVLRGINDGGVDEVFFRKWLA